MLQINTQERRHVDTDIGLHIFTEDLKYLIILANNNFFKFLI